MYKLIVIGIVFLLGIYFIYKSNDIEAFHGIDGDNKNSSTSDGRDKIAKNCPDVLIQKGSTLFLYNSKRASVPGVNPIRFENLDEYIEFTEWQRSQGILCPILYLQHAYNAQGDSVYKARPSPTNLQGGLPDYYVNFDPNNFMPPPSTNYSVQGFSPGTAEEGTQGASAQGTGTAGASKLVDAGQNNLPYNMNNYPGFDAHNQYVGIDTPLDKMYNDVTNKVSPNPMDDTWGGIEYTEKLVASGYFSGNEVSKGGLN